MPPVVLFVCIRNAGRSQMAEAILRARAGGRVVARSAGSAPADAVHPEAVTALREIGLEAGSAPKGLAAEVLDGVTIVVGMGCGDACPAIPGASHIAWDVPDPAGRTLEEVRAIRDEIARLVDALIEGLW